MSGGRIGIAVVLSTLVLAAAPQLAAGEPTAAQAAESLPSFSLEQAVAADGIIYPASATLGDMDHSAGGEKSACTCEKAQALNKAAAGAYKGVFYDNNFDYLCDPCYCDWHLGENLKRIGVTPWMTVDVGGQYRARLHNERNMRNAPPIGLGFTGVDDDFLLHRTRLYVNAEIGDRIRFYGEMLDAYSQFEDDAPRAIEENRTELQNLFLDVVAVEGPRGDLTARLGRQEVILGAQRLVSPLDWANTRRTFEGARLMWRGEDWDIDALWVMPMERRVHRLDPPDDDRHLYGVYSTYKGLCRDRVELYWLALDYRNLGAPPDNAFRYDTLGARYWGERNDWLYEAEAGVQFGTNLDDTDHRSGFYTLGLGRRFASASWKPTLWGYYDWASGADEVNDGFHHYEPLAHRYNGFMDLFGRRNLINPNLLLTMQPAEKLQLLLWYHYFRLQNGNDVPYSVVMTPYANQTSGTGVKDLGHEIDFVATWTISPRLELLFGYSHFFAGEYFDSIPFDLPAHADFFYTQFTVNF